MKKLLIILMVVAMASFLFVGCIPTVPVAVTGVTLDKATMTLTAGGATGTLVATVAPADASNTSVTWSSSAMAVATVVNGVVTPLTEGTTTITVTTVDGSFTATCAVTVTPTVVPTSDPPVMTAVKTSAEVLIFSATATGTLYMNKVDAGTSILVIGTNAPSESSVQIYLDDVAIAGAVGEASVSGSWSVAVAKTSLGDDGAGKVLHATATEVGLAESAASNSVTFTLDTLKPSATTLVASAFTAAAQTIDSAITAGAAVIDSAVVNATAAADMVSGTWTITIVADSATNQNIKLSDGTNETLWSVNAAVTWDGTIPGVRLAFTNPLLTTSPVGSITTLTLKNTPAIGDRATVLFSEDITSASAIALANFTWGNSTLGIAPVDTPVAYKSLTTYFTLDNSLRRFDAISCLVNNVVDLAGNIQTTASALTCTVDVAHLTTLAP